MDGEFLLSSFVLETKTVEYTINTHYCRSGLFCVQNSTQTRMYQWMSYGDLLIYQDLHKDDNSNRITPPRFVDKYE